MKCPKCSSRKVAMVGKPGQKTKKKQVSAGKVAVGVLTGGLSLLATGVHTKESAANGSFCRECGHRWK